MLPTVTSATAQPRVARGRTPAPPFHSCLRTALAVPSVRQDSCTRVAPTLSTAGREPPHLLQGATRKAAT